MIRLDLASGPRPKDGFQGVDICKGAQHHVNLFYPDWPWPDHSVDELWCSHFVEHIPVGFDHQQDQLFSFFDECWRILKPDHRLTVIVPSAETARAFQDPTHRRFLVPETFLYLNASWRRDHQVAHYNVLCDFAAKVTELQAVVYGRDVRRWTSTVDLVAELRSIVPGKSLMP
jgi:hypothetical protein